MPDGVILYPEGERVPIKYIEFLFSIRYNNENDKRIDSSEVYINECHYHDRP